MLRRASLSVFLILLVAVAANPATAEVDWNLALRSESDIIGALTGLESDAPGLETAPAVQLLREVGWEVLPGSRVLYRNLVMEVRDPAAIADLASSFYLDARGSVESAQAFLIRDGEVTRPKVSIERGDGEVKRTRLAVDLGGVQAGDIVGFSSITRFDGILYFDTVPVSAPMPVANFSLRVRCEQSHTYKIAAVGPAEMDIAVVARDEGRPIEWHATATAVAPDPKARGGGIYTPGMSLALVAESTEYVPAANSWMSTLAWQRVALFLAGLRESGLASMVAVRDRAAEITAGATTDLEKEQKIFAWVKDELGLLLGPAYEPIGHRKANDILADGKANPMEKVLLMVTLLDAVGIDGQVAVVRSEDWGPLQQDMQSFVQFRDLAVRCGTGDDARLFVPYVDVAPAGGLPAEWGTCWVLAPAPGLMAKVSEAASQVMSQPNVDVHAAFLQVRERAAKEGWYTLEQVSGGS